MDPRAVRAELDRILQSPGFANSDRMARFLRCVVERAIAGRGDELKEYLIGVEAFDRRPDYDPRVDPIVRVEARRLRAKLKEFYERHGKGELDLVIELPKGAYVPCFQKGPAVELEEGSRPSSVAVLPITNNSRDAEYDFLCDGITQEVIHALTKASGLRVVAWHSSARFSAPEQDVYSIGKQLRVSYVLRGSLRAAGGRMRLLAQLINTNTGEYVWSESYDRQMADIFDIEQEISIAIVRALRTKMGVTRRPTPNPAAYSLYLRGRHQWNKRTDEGLRNAVEHFRAAVSLDPEFALGYAGLADAYILLADYSADAPGSVIGYARAAAQKALDIDNSLGEAEASLALIASLYDWNWPAAGEHYRRAIELNPSYATAYHWYGLDYCALLGRFEEARRSVRTAIELDPLSAPLRESVGYLNLLERRFDEAEESFRGLIEFDPVFYKGWTGLGRALFFQGRHEEAIAALEKGLSLTGEGPTLFAALAQTCAQAGRQHEAERWLAQLETMAGNRYVPRACLAVACLGIGDTAGAVEHLQAACASRELPLSAIGVHPLWDPLRKHPAFRAVLEQVGVARAA